MNRTRASSAAELLACVLLGGSCQTTTPIPTPSHRGPVTSLVVAGARLMSCSQSLIHTGRAWIRLDIRAFAMAASATHLLVVGGDPAEHTDLSLRDHHGKQLAKRRLGSDVSYAVDLHPQANLAAIGCADGSVHLLSLPDLQTLRSLARHNAPCRAVLFSADGSQLASAGRDGLIHLHDLASTTHQTLADHSAGVECLCFVDHDLYSGALDGKVRLHRSGRLLRTYLDLRQPVMALTRDGEQVCLGLRDGTVRALSPSDATTTFLGRTRAPLFSLAVSQGRLIAGGKGLISPVVD